MNGKTCVSQRKIVKTVIPLKKKKHIYCFTKGRHSWLNIEPSLRVCGIAHCTWRTFEPKYAGKVRPDPTPLHSCAEPNWWIKSGKRAASESIRYGSFNSVRQVRQGLPHYSTLERQLIHTALFPRAEPNALIMAPLPYPYHIRFDTQYAVWVSCRANVAPKSNLIQLGSAHE